MFCINCFEPKTKVTNSRTRSKRPAVWRRRNCEACDYVFTTYEQPSLAESKTIHSTENKTEEFNLGRLIISIAAAFQHDPEAAKNDALWLAQTVEQTLLTERRHINREDITATTHQVLKRYDELAAVQYAAKHQLITSTRRRPGRPPLSPS